MATLEEEFAAYKSQGQASQEYGEWKRRQAHEADLRAGGSIKQGLPSRNLPVGATVGGVGATIASSGNIGIGLLGAAGGEAIQQGVEHLLDDPSAPKTGLESAQRIGEETGMQLLGEGVVRTGLKVGAPLVSRFAPAMSAEGEQAFRFLDPRTPLPFMPAEVTDTSALDIFHNIAEGAILGRGTIEGFKRQRYDEVFTGLADELVNDLGPRLSPDAVGRTVTDVIHRNLELKTLPATMIYKMLDRAASPTYTTVPRRMTVQRTDVPVTKEAIESMSVKKTYSKPKSTEPVIEYDDAGDALASRVEPSAPELRGMTVDTKWQDIQIGERLERLKIMVTSQELQIHGARVDLTPLKESIGGLVKIAQQAGGLADREMGNTLLSFLAQKPDLVSYPVAKAIRTEVRTLRDTLMNSVEAKNAPAIGRAKGVYAELTKAIRSGLNDYDPFLSSMWDEANFIERAGQMQFNGQLLRSLIRNADETGKGKPEAIAKAVFKDLTTLRLAKNAIASDPDWNKVLSVKLQDLFEQARNPTTKEISGMQLREAMFGRNGVGAQAMITAYGPERVALYRQFANALEVSQARQGSGVGGVAIQLQQPGAVIQLSGAGLAAFGLANDSDYSVAAGGVIILGPAILAKAMTNPTTARWMLDGMRLDGGVRTAGIVVAKLVSSLFPKEYLSQSPPPLKEQNTSLPRAFQLQP